jgi:hypothetical protein
MRRFLLCAIGLGLLFPLATHSLGQGNIPTIEEIMSKAHKPKKLREQIKADLDKSSPDWPAIQKKSKDFLTLASALEKNSPPRGDVGSWKKLSKDYADTVKMLDDAVGKKDVKAAQAANTRLTTKCMECHKIHRE